MEEYKTKDTKTGIKLPGRGTKGHWKAFPSLHVEICIPLPKVCWVAGHDNHNREGEAR